TEAFAVYETAAKLPGIVVEGVSCHIGSQLLSIHPLLEAAEKLLALVDRLRERKLPIRYFDLGGGLGVPYRSTERGVAISTFVQRLRAKIENLDITLLLEPGRSIVAEAGVLLSRVLLLKRNGAKTFIVLDAAMNDLIRPALYQAHHEIVPVNQLRTSEHITADVVGPVCETGDFFARERELPALAPGDLVAIRTTGAYGFVLASNYNSRPRPCELLVQGAHVHLARKRETYKDLVRGERGMPAESGEVLHTGQERDRFADLCPGSS
ncbi:MAG: hypothetical protein JOZ62_14735, partial [Acidobacteriaceae bacterium]|nr:hypothetical protein [Acidobacteriaceae bacterium]